MRFSNAAKIISRMKNNTGPLLSNARYLQHPDVAIEPKKIQSPRSAHPTLKVSASAYVRR
jgi:hypothetical protein